MTEVRRSTNSPIVSEDLHNHLQQVIVSRTAFHIKRHFGGWTASELQWQNKTYIEKMIQLKEENPVPGKTKDMTKTFKDAFFSFKQRIKWKLCIRMKRSRPILAPPTDTGSSFLVLVTLTLSSPQSQGQSFDSSDVSECWSKVSCEFPLYWLRFVVGLR